MKKLLLALLASLFLTSFVTAISFDSSLKFELQSPQINSLTSNPNATYTHTNGPINFTGGLPVFIEMKPGNPVPIKTVRIYMHTLKINGRPPLNKPFLDRIQTTIYPKAQFEELNPYHHTVAKMFPQWGNITTIFDINGIICEVDVGTETINNCNEFMYGLLNNNYIHPSVNSNPLSGSFKYMKQKYSYHNAQISFTDRLQYPFMFNKGFYYVPWLTNIAVLFPWGQYRFYAVAELADGNYVVSNSFTAEALEPGIIGGNSTVCPPTC